MRPAPERPITANALLWLSIALERALRRLSGCRPACVRARAKIGRTKSAQVWPNPGRLRQHQAKAGRSRRICIRIIAIPAQLRARNRPTVMWHLSQAWPGWTTISTKCGALSTSFGNLLTSSARRSHSGEHGPELETPCPISKVVRTCLGIWSKSASLSEFDRACTESM